MRLTPELIKKICRYVENGNTYERSCALVGIHESTFYKWKQRGLAEKEGLYFELVESVKKADEKFIAYHVANITKHSDDDWKASAWMLERKKKKEFGRNLDVTTKGESINQFKISLDDE